MDIGKGIFFSSSSPFTVYQTLNINRQFESIYSVIKKMTIHFLISIFSVIQIFLQCCATQAYLEGSEMNLAGESHYIVLMDNKLAQDTG